MKEENPPEREDALNNESPISQFCSSDIITCSPQTPLWKAAEKMATFHCSSIVILSGETPVGIWTEKDSLSVRLGDNEYFSSKISDWMSSPVKSIEKSVSVYTAILLMRKENIRHLIVTDDGKPYGVVSLTDLVFAPELDYLLKSATVESAADSACLKVPKETRMQEAADLMKQGNHSAIIVEYQNAQYGIITERDIIKAIAARSADLCAGDVATYPLVSVLNSDTLYHARQVFIEKKVRHLAVFNDREQFFGVLDFRKLLAQLEYSYVNELKKKYDKTNHALSVAEHQLTLIEKVIESSLDGVMITDTDGKIKSINPAFTFITGYSEEEVTGKKPSILKSNVHDDKFYSRMWGSILDEGYWQGEVWNKKKNGSVYPQHLTIAAVQDIHGKYTHYLAIIKDLSESKAKEETIFKLAYNNPISGLPNYRLLLDRLSMVLAKARRKNEEFSVTHIIINRYKTIQESLGYQTGEFIIKTLAMRMKTCIREQDSLAHINVNEFILVSPETANPDKIYAILSRLQECIEKPVDAGKHQVFVNASFGIASYEGGDYLPEHLIQNAIVTNQTHFQESESAFHFYSPEADLAVKESILLESGLRSALEKNELSLVYQPIVSAGKNEIVGFEALLRWENSFAGSVPPSRFIPLAEESGLIINIGEWVIEKAFEDYKEIQKNYGDNVYVSINISIKQLISAKFTKRLIELIKIYNMPKNSFFLELTENILFDLKGDNLEILTDLQENGIQLMIDDFGTGFSSLSYLKNFPVSRVKIDRSFIQDIEPGNKAFRMATAIVELAKTVDLETIVEGVETKEQKELIEQTGCGYIQGYYFGKPAPLKTHIKKI